MERLQSIVYHSKPANAVAVLTDAGWCVKDDVYPSFFAKMEPDHTRLRVLKMQGRIKEIRPARKQILWDHTNKLRNFTEIETYGPGIVPQLADELAQIEIPVFQADLKYILKYLFQTKTYIYKGVKTLRAVILDTEVDQRSNIPFLISGTTGEFSLETFQFTPANTFTFDGDFLQNIAETFDILRQARLVVGHNIGFDLRVMNDYAISRGVQGFEMYETKSFLEGIFGWTTQFTKYIPCFDTLYATPLTLTRPVSFNLKYLVDALHLRTDRRVYMNTKHIYKDYQDHRQKVIAYNQDDVNDTFLLFNYIAAVPWTAAIQSGIPIEQVFMSGHKSVWETLMARECVKRNMLVPQYQSSAKRRERVFANPMLSWLGKFGDFKGGQTKKLNAKYCQRVLKHVYHVDIISAYPNINLTKGISPETVTFGTGPKAQVVTFKSGKEVSLLVRPVPMGGILPAILKPINDAVVALKKLKKKDASLQPRYDGFKRLRDASWSSIAAKEGNSRFQNPYSSSLTAHYCRQIIDIITDELQKYHDFDVFHVDTDGDHGLPYSGQLIDDFHDRIVAIEDILVEKYGPRFGEDAGTGLDVEHFPGMWFLDIKDYVGLDDTGKFVIHGSKLIQRGYTRLEREGIRQVFQALFKDGHLAAKAAMQAVEDQILTSTDIEDFAINVFLKEIENYTSRAMLKLVNRIGSGNVLVVVVPQAPRDPKPNKYFRLLEDCDLQHLDRRWYVWRLKKYIFQDLCGLRLDQTRLEDWK